MTYEPKRFLDSENVSNSSYFEGKRISPEMGAFTKAALACISIDLARALV